MSAQIQPCVSTVGPTRGWLASTCSHWLESIVDGFWHSGLRLIKAHFAHVALCFPASLCVFNARGSAGLSCRHKIMCRSAGLLTGQKKLLRHSFNFWQRHFLKNSSSTNITLVHFSKIRASHECSARLGTSKYNQLITYWMNPAVITSTIMKRNSIKTNSRLKH